MFLDEDLIDTVKAFKLLYDLSGKDLYLIDNVHIDTQSYQWEHMYYFIYSRIFDTLNIYFDIEHHPEIDELWYLIFKSRTYITYKHSINKASFINKANPYIYTYFNNLLNSGLSCINDLFYALEGALKLEDYIEEKEVIGFKILCEFVDTPDKLINFICRYVQFQKEIICIIKSINRKFQLNNYGG